MTRHLTALGALVLMLGACGGKAADNPAAAASPAAQQSQDEETFYALGRLMGRNIAGWQLTPGELESLKRGLADASSGAKSDFDLTAFQARIQALAEGRVAKAAEANKAKSATFLAEAEKESGATKTASGMIFRSLKPGSGASPKPESEVKVHYEGKLVDGTVFDSSIKRGEPVSFPLGGVIPCWQEGLQKMKVGEKAQLVCPSSIAYGDQGRPPIIPGGATLVFEVELLQIVK